MKKFISYIIFGTLIAGFGYVLAVGSMPLIGGLPFGTVGVVLGGVIAVVGYVMLTVTILGLGVYLGMRSANDKPW